MSEMTAMGSARTALLHILDETGDTKVMWNPRDVDEVKAAQKTFERLTGKGFRAFRVNSTGGQGERIEAFDKEAEKIILIPQLAGGS